MLVMYFFYADFRSQNMEPFFNIPLNISNSLQQSLDDYVAQQVLNAENMYYTDMYGPQQAKKSVKFLTLPPIIMVQLKRFEYNSYTGKNEKIMHRFQYPSVVDFSRWQINSTQMSQGNSCNYELYAVLVHQGVKAQSGHYYAFVKIHDCWYRFNDQQVSLASNLQVFDYNYGGQIQVYQFDHREFKVYNRKTVSNSTAYMLVYVDCSSKQKLLQSDPTYPQWLKQHQILKQQQREQLRNRKNYYHDVHAFYWDTSFKDCIGDYLGFVPKSIQEHEGQIIGKLTKNDKIQEWVKPYNDKGLGVYLYLTTTQKIQYQTLINLQHRKTNFQQIVRDPNCPIIIIFMPLIAHLDSYVYVIKMSRPVIKFRDQGQPQHEISIKFNNIIEINRNSRNSQLLAKLNDLYAEQGYSVAYYYQQKKQLTQIKEDNCLIRGPPLLRNVLGIIIVQKIQIQLKQKFPNPTIKWYNDLKNFIQIFFKSQCGKYSFNVVIDQNKSVQSLRQYIYETTVKQDQACLSPQNIVLKAKHKKTAKNYIEVTGAKTIRDLIKNCDKQNIIVFSFSNLKVQERRNQFQIKFYYRFKDFSISELFHVILDRNSENKSVNIYQNIADHQQVKKFKQKQNMKGIRIFLFSKDKNVINDIVFQNGHVHGKGQIANVLQKQKGSHLVVESFEVQRIEQNICPILMHHRSQSEEKIGIPRYLEFDRSTRLTQIHDQILNLIKDDVYQWQEKKVKINPMKVTLYAYAKDFNKGIYLLDEQTLVQNQLQEANQKIKQAQRQQQKIAQQQQKKAAIQKQKNKQIEKNRKQQKLTSSNEIIGSINNTNNNQMAPDNKIQDQELEKQKNQKKLNKVQIVIDSSEQQKNKFENKHLNGQFLNVQDNQVQDNDIKPNNLRKNSKCQLKLKSWQKTIENAFLKAKYIKVVVHHLYLSKAQTAMKINV